MMNVAKYIDHTNLKQDNTRADIIRLCGEARGAGFAAVCVAPVYVREAEEQLAGSDVKIATVIGFPFGYHLPPVKTTEAELAIISGADELDMVANITAIKSGEWKLLETEIREMLEVIKLRGKVIKVIIESGILTRDELLRCCELYAHFGIDFMKTSTGFAAAGASVASVRLMRENLPDRIAIKASGGISTYAFATELIAAGAARIGSSSSLQILAESGAAQ